MKCIEHPEIDAVSTCARCGGGLCHECVSSTFFQIDNKPLCKKCNCEICGENDRVFKAVLKSKQIRMGVFAVTFVIGLVSLISSLAKESSTVSAVIGMLFFWGLGFIGNFFDKNEDTRSVKSQTKDAMLEIKYPVSTLVGKILGFFIMAVSSPLQILFAIIGIVRVKKQIARNAAILQGLESA
jgi:hypothetical protein